MLTTAGPPPSPPLLLLLILLLITSPPPSNSLSFSQFQTLFSLSHSLMTRVANLRASRGDLSGSDRARLIAAKLKRATGLGFWGAMWSVGWDYVRNYSWRDFTASFEVRGAVSDLNELLRALNELTRMESPAERVEWVSRNYKNALRVSRSLLQRLLQVFGQSGPLREVVETVQKEVVEGELLRDCLELGNDDLKGLIQIFKDIALQFSSNPDRSHDL
ncbi:uncharacterized protein LOC114265522 [Camellia sinensis]|uniref:Uncharacterized protein n=1 Tax=Camellia sinensis var. sinensis TaxID=542762 RepID=A0A4S4ELZ8_CAMSN|nr:uncharacterized protein LOC114265522 [Camellia sinensis]THG17660.1 hypothetical protein TEA_014769 [Camellia sinensis var. sinensis]